MHDAPAVQRLEGAEDPESDLERFGQREGLAGDPLGQRLPGEQLHDQIQLALLLGELVHMAHIGVADAGGGARLSEQPIPQAGIGGCLADPLDGDLAVEALVVGGEHHAHAAFTQLPGDAVVADGVRFGRGLRRLSQPAEHRALE